MNETKPSGFFPWLRGLGMVRSSGDRWFAGVSAGIAAKANIDPLIVRAAFVALTVLGGPGILLYIIAWMLLPDSDGKIHLEELFQGRATTAVAIAIVVFVVWLITVIFGNLLVPSLAIWNWDLWGAIGVPGWVSVTFAWFFWIAVIAVIGLLIHRMILQHGRDQKKREHAQRESAPEAATYATPTTPPEPATQPEPAAPPEPAAQPATAYDYAERAETWANDFSEQASNWGEEFSEKATEWGHTVGDKANEWSAQYAERYEHTNMGTAQKLLTLAFAFLAAGGAALWAMSSNLTITSALPSEWALVFFAAVLAGTAVIALSMILAGIRGRHSGGIGFLGFVGVITLIVTAVLPWGTHYRLAGNHSVGAEAASVVTIVGETHADLTGLNSPRSPDEYLISHGLGNIELDLPDDRKTVVHLTSFAGRIEFTDDDTSVRRGGLFNHRTFTVNESGNEPALIVTVRVLAGNITVND